jgi:hypothetical protein
VDQSEIDRVGDDGLGLLSLERPPELVVPLKEAVDQLGFRLEGYVVIEAALPHHNAYHSNSLVVEHCLGQAR